MTLTALVLAMLCVLLSGDAHAQDEAWPEAMRRVHVQHTGEPGTLAFFGDSITVSLAFWAPLEHQPMELSPEMAEALAVVKEHQKPACWREWRGPEFGNEGRMTIRWAESNVETWLAKLNPEAAVIMFGTNDLTELPWEEYETKTRAVVERCLENGTVVLLTTPPPRHGVAEKSAEFAEAVRRVARELHVPLIDYHAEILKRRPDDWDGASAKFKDIPGGTYDVPTLIARDGVHPSNPQDFRDYSDRSLSHNGFALRNALTLERYAEVVRQVLEK